MNSGERALLVGFLMTVGIMTLTVLLSKLA